MKPKVFITSSGKRLEGKANPANITTLTDRLPNTRILQPWKRYYSPWEKAEIDLEKAEVKAEVEEETPINNMSIIEAAIVLLISLLIGFCLFLIFG